jgi:hypothetical protein
MICDPGYLLVYVDVSESEFSGLYKLRSSNSHFSAYSFSMTFHSPLSACNRPFCMFICRLSDPWLRDTPPNPERLMIEMLPDLFYGYVRTTFEQQEGWGVGIKFPV